MAGDPVWPVSTKLATSGSRIVGTMKLPEEMQRGVIVTGEGVRGKLENVGIVRNVRIEFCWVDNCLNQVLGGLAPTDVVRQNGPTQNSSGESVFDEACYPSSSR